MALATLTSLAASPWAPVGAAALSGIYGAIAPNRAKELQDKIIQGYDERRERAQRMARGQFTPDERSQIRTAAQPQLQQVAGSIASRGLGSSPAGAAIAAGAEQQVFRNAQQMAIAEESIVNREAFAATVQMADEDEGFFQSLQSIFASIHRLRELNQTPDPRSVQALLAALGAKGKGTTAPTVSDGGYRNV